MVCFKKYLSQHKMLKNVLFTPILDKGSHLATTFNAWFRLRRTGKHPFCFFGFLKSGKLGTWIQCIDFFLDYSRQIIKVPAR